MKQEKFVGLLNQGKIGEILAEGGVDLTKEQLETVKHYAEEASKKELQKRQFEVASLPGYAESHILPAIRDMLLKVGTQSFIDAGQSKLSDKNIIKRALGSKDSENKNSDVVNTTPTANRPSKRSSGKNINTAFYSTISQEGAVLKNGDSLANIAAKTLIMHQKIRNEKRREFSAKKSEYRKIQKEEKNKDKTYSKIDKDKKNKKQNISTKIIKYFALGAALVVFPSMAEAAFTDMGDMIKGFSDKIKKMLDPTLDSSEEVSNIDEIKKFISGKESGGDYNRLVTSKSGDEKLPSEFKNIDLSNMTIDEVMKLQDKMLKSGLFPSSALGKYQFTRAAIQDTSKNLNIDTKTTKYTEEVQEKLMDSMLKDEVSQIQSMGLPVTKGNVYLRHFAGPAGFKKLMTAPDTANVGEVLGPEAAKANPRIAKKTIGELKNDYKSTPVTPPMAGKNIEKDSRPISDMANKVKVKVATMIHEKSIHYISPDSGGSETSIPNIPYEPYEPKAGSITK